MKLDELLNSFSNEFRQTNLKYYIDSIIKPYKKFPEEYDCFTKHLNGYIKRYSFRVGFVHGDFTIVGTWHQIILVNVLNDKHITLNPSVVNSSFNVEEANSTLFEIFD